MQDFSGLSSMTSQKKT